MKTSWKVLGTFPVLFSILCTIAVEIFDVVLVSLPVDSAFHFSLMTVNALFGGFLYSNYGMLVGLLDNETIQKVKGTAIMTKRNWQVFVWYCVCDTFGGMWTVHYFDWRTRRNDWGMPILLDDKW